MKRSSLITLPYIQSTQLDAFASEFLLDCRDLYTPSSKSYRSGSECILFSKLFYFLYDQ